MLSISEPGDLDEVSSLAAQPWPTLVWILAIDGECWWRQREVDVALLRRTRALTGQHHRAAELELDGAIGLGVHAHDGRRVRGADAAVVALPALRGRAGQAEPRQRERGGPALAAVAD